jgi:hypothetical protein
MPLFYPLMDGPILMDPGPTCSRWALLQIFLVPEVSTQVPLACTDLSPPSPWEASLAIWTVSSGASAGLCPQEMGHNLTAREAKMPTLVSPFPSQCTRNIVGNSEGNKVTKTTLQESGILLC